ncbi:hypothetical protein [Actinomyces sp. MRS3W]|uniref:hypothetical protein n=1 Tax=Actinomyces sp. MRS3W TaxID=2800796 RepID=UPI0028FD23A3|nr:hypothetical protein [Actinomyces sp. MRS3W]MDU0349409.1 hypothetical protein [Actinomyces sp. MRS3W]
MSKKRTAGIVVLAGLAALALPFAVGHSGDAATTAPEPAASSQAPLAPEVEELAHHELAGDELTFAPGMEVPSPADLMPELAGATVQEQDGTSLTLEADSANTAARRDLEDSGLDPDSTGVTIHVAEGDLAVSEVIYWQCGWIDEYLNAADAGDTTRMARAESQLNTFPTLNAITTYAPEFTEQHEHIVVPMLDGDLDTGRYWLTGNCDHYIDR